jgi:hypothetical protein
MKEFRAHWLPDKWEQTVHTEILNSCLRPPQRFEDWADQILSNNVSLQNTASHMNDEQLRIQLMAALDDELHTLVTDNNISEVSDLRNWMTEVCKLDNKRQFDQARVENALKNLGYSRTNNRQTATNRYQLYNNANRNRNSRGNSATPSMDPNTYPPKLTDEERRLLHEHDGCLKCRVFYAGHRANKCTITLSGKDYKP